MLKIENRRYIGSKSKLSKRIYNEVLSRMKPPFKFADLFAGTGIVASEFSKNNVPIIVNDILFSNYISYQAWFSNEIVNIKKIEELIDKFNNIPYKQIEENYFSNIYGGRYFSINDAKKIGYIREKIELEKENLNYREYCVLITSLMYFTDKIANTVGHFEHYLKKEPIDTKFKLQMLNLSNNSNNNVEIYQLDANDLIGKIQADVIYIDPPYNSRQYVNFYHVLENLVTWKKPDKFQGKSMKFKREHLKSGYSKVIAKHLLADLIDKAKAKLIIMSYNNTYNAKSVASNNKISNEEITQILEKKGTLEIIEIDYAHFNSGKTNFKNHKELLYICNVKNNE